MMCDGITASRSKELQEPECIIVAPTRELISQIYLEARKFSFGYVHLECHSETSFSLENYCIYFENIYNTKNETKIRDTYDHEKLERKISALEEQISSINEKLEEIEDNTENNTENNNYYRK